jgi:hypothetical protein
VALHEETNTWRILFRDCQIDRVDYCNDSNNNGKLLTLEATLLEITKPLAALHLGEAVSEETIITLLGAASAPLARLKHLYSSDGNTVLLLRHALAKFTYIHTQTHI